VKTPTDPAINAAVPTRRAIRGGCTAQAKDIAIISRGSKKERRSFGLARASSLDNSATRDWILHQGLIWAKNRNHGGASFRIKLPLSMEAIETKQAMATGIT
jgi:hypothetical protein